MLIGIPAIAVALVMLAAATGKFSCAQPASMRINSLDSVLQTLDAEDAVPINMVMTVASADARARESALDKVKLEPPGCGIGFGWPSL